MADDDNANHGFLSTPSVWRATFSTRSMCEVWFISIHALRVEGDGVTTSQQMLRSISIHALRVEGDSTGSTRWARSLDYFYPRPPCGGRRFVKIVYTAQELISIHALRVEGDQRRRKTNRPGNNFYPRPPCGGRPLIFITGLSLLGFLSTPSVWRATQRHIKRFLLLQHFYPRPPCGGRQIKRLPQGFHVVISIHALRVEGDVGTQYEDTDTYKFLSTPSVWRAT